jgi:hypothetical protein
VCVFLCLCTGISLAYKESYRLSLIKKLRKLSPMLRKREQAPKCGSNEEEEKKCTTVRTVADKTFASSLVSKRHIGLIRLRMRLLMDIFVAGEREEFAGLQKHGMKNHVVSVIYICINFDKHFCTKITY